MTTVDLTFALTTSTFYATRSRSTSMRPASHTTTRIYLAALDGLIRHLEANGMPTGVAAPSAGSTSRATSGRAGRRQAGHPLDRVPRPRHSSGSGRVDEDEVVRLAHGEDEAAQIPDVAGPRRLGRRLPQAAQDGRGHGLHRPSRHARSCCVLYDTGVRLGELAGHAARGRRSPRPAGLRHRQVAGTSARSGSARRRPSLSTATSASAAVTACAASTRPVARPGRPAHRRPAFGADASRSGARPPGWRRHPPAPVPPHVRPRVPRQRRPGRRSAAARRLALAR